MGDIVMSTRTNICMGLDRIRHVIHESIKDLAEVASLLANR